MKHPKTLGALMADPRVKRVYRDSDGLWVDLANGWKNTYDEPLGALHGIHENTVRDACNRMPSVLPCDCEFCLQAKAKAAR